MSLRLPGAQGISPVPIYIWLLLSLSISLSAVADTLTISEAEWEGRDSKLEVKGKNAGRRATVEIFDAVTAQSIAIVRANKEGRWRLERDGIDSPPCRVRVTAGDMTTERDVKDAPAVCSGAVARSSSEPEYEHSEDEESDGEHAGGDSEGDGGNGYSDSHQGLVYNGPGTCLECHEGEAHDVLVSTHYLWQGSTPDMLNQTGVPQGKNAGAINAYCGNIVGNWAGCSTCHIGRGAEPEAAPTTVQLENIDCLICHQEQYKRKRVNGIMVPDTDNMTITMDEAVQTIHSPTRVTCLQCHAKAGGGDAVKRGDLALASGITADKHYDAHMATTGANLNCQDCHRPEAHRFPGKGSDIRPTDLVSAVECASSGCHSATPHDSKDLNRHLERVACQTCHIPIYAKDASDTVATEATETHRSWRDGTDHATPPYHPVTEKANNLIPVYRFWNRLSDNTLLFDTVIENPLTETVETSVPDGAVDDAASKLYPFKYKTSDYPMRTASNQLIALDTAVFFATADPDSAVMSGLGNMKDLEMQALGTSEFDPGDAYDWVLVDTYQLLNHQVSPHDEALNCTQCHMRTARMDLQGDLGYAPTKSHNTCAQGCHKAKKAREWRYGSFEEFREGHKKHREKKADCIECHAFNR